MQGAINIEDLRKLAKKRLPKIAYDFIEGGVDDEVGLVTNEQSFRRARLVPRYLVDVTVRDQSTTLFGRTYASPIGIAPTGIAGLFRPGADLMLAEAARDANVPFIMSGAATGSIEDLGRIAPDHGWYQLYSAKDDAISADLIARAGDAGLRTLVFTVDVPVGSNRERNLRNGWGWPLNMSLATKLEALRHPGWLLEYLRTGTPLFANWRKYAGADATPEATAIYMSTQNRAPMTWKHVETFRKLWKGNLVLKGIMHPDDARRAATLGVDGLMVSNHGARQLDLAPAPLEVLPAIRDAVGDRLTVMFDGGIRRGADVLVALCRGAKFVFVGRPTLYGVAAGGTAGATHALGIFKREIDLCMAQMGAPTIADLGPQFLMWEDEEDLRRNRR
ncbi:MAG: alpha-hydroxy-acid oxidizing protein [Alphaproteobacteria bacterium]|nr:alpha-hydroxy-acid oxidizing protein [Alphaproteobacteria bacterium]